MRAIVAEAIDGRCDRLLDVAVGVARRCLRQAGAQPGGGAGGDLGASPPRSATPDAGTIEATWGPDLFVEEFAASSNDIGRPVSGRRSWPRATSPATPTTSPLGSPLPAATCTRRSLAGRSSSRSPSTTRSRSPTCRRSARCCPSNARPRPRALRRPRVARACRPAGARRRGATSSTAPRWPRATSTASCATDRRSASSPPARAARRWTSWSSWPPRRASRPAFLVAMTNDDEDGVARLLGNDQLLLGLSDAGAAHEPAVRRQLRDPPARPLVARHGRAHPGEGGVAAHRPPGQRCTASRTGGHRSRRGRRRRRVRPGDRGHDPAGAGRRLPRRRRPARRDSTGINTCGCPGWPCARRRRRRTHTPALSNGIEHDVGRRRRRRACSRRAPTVEPRRDPGARCLAPAAPPLSWRHADRLATTARTTMTARSRPDRPGSRSNAWRPRGTWSAMVESPAIRRALRPPRPGDRPSCRPRWRSGGAAEIDAAVTAAAAAAPGWRAMPLEERAAILHRLADLLVGQRRRVGGARTRATTARPISTMRPGVYAAVVGALLRRLGRQARRVRSSPCPVAGSTTCCPSRTA